MKNLPVLPAQHAASRQQNLAEDIIQFNSPTDRNVWTSLSTFLDRTEQTSKNTRMTYERPLREFFRIMRNKELEELVEADLIFTKQQIMTYQVGLKKRYKGTTVNNKISALKACYLHLEDHGFDVRPSWFNVKRYSESDKQRYDKMTYEEVQDCIKLVETTRNGTEKALLIKMAFATAFRKEALLNIKWTDIYRRHDVWIVKGFDKGEKWDHKKISDTLYNELQAFRGESDRPYVFTISSKTVDRMMKYIQTNIDFGERNIVFHSFKKTSINEVALMTNYDLKAMQAQGNHASITTTLEDYMADKTIDDLVMVDIDRQLPLDKFEALTHEELLQLVLNADRATQIKLLNQLEQ